MHDDVGSSQSDLRVTRLWNIDDLLRLFIIKFRLLDDRPDFGMQHLPPTRLAGSRPSCLHRASGRSTKCIPSWD